MKRSFGLGHTASKKESTASKEWSERRPDESEKDYDTRLEERRKELQRIPTEAWNDVMTPG